MVVGYIPFIKDERSEMLLHVFTEFFGYGPRSGLYKNILSAINTVGHNNKQQRQPGKIKHIPSIQPVRRTDHIQTDIFEWTQVAN